MAISSKVSDRIASQLKKYQSILTEARDRDISESDTVVIIVDLLADVLGYKKYLEITTEHSVRGTYVDLAVKVGNDVRFLIEAKSIGVSLKENHVRQAIDYGANHGIEWIVLTNAVHWQVYKVHFKQPIEKSMIFEIDLLNVNPKSPQVIECFGNLSREGFNQSSMSAFFQQRQMTGKFSVAALLLCEPMVAAIRKEIRRVSPGCKVEIDDVKALLQSEIIKRELLDGDEAKGASDFFRKAYRALDREKAKLKQGSDREEAPASPPPASPPQDDSTTDRVGT